MINRCFLITAAALLASCGSSPPRAKDFSESAYENVKSAYETAGARVERSGTIVRIYLPMKVALDMTPSQAKTLAADAQNRLGSDSAVYIKGPGGDTLASQ